jgi:hypothetical protein
MRLRPPDPWRLALVVLAVALAPLTTRRLYAVDEIQYFVYLRSAVFDRDLDFENEYRWFAGRDPDAYQRVVEELFLGNRTPTGRPINNAPIGNALLWAPFYLAAVGTEAAGLTTPSDPPGYSRLDISAVCVASMLYAVAGLLLVHETCRRFAAPPAAFAATVLTWLATNLVFYTYVTPPMSHACSFFTGALFLYWWLLRDDGSPTRGFVTGILLGLFASVRWQDLLYLVAPLGAPVLGNRIRDVQSLGRWMTGSAALGAGCLLAFLPQLAVWKVLNGTPFRPYSVYAVGSRFDPAAPHLFAVFFSAFHGLFVWTPLLAPALAGLVAVAKAEWRMRGVLLAVALEIYLLACYVTTFGHSFGQRLFVSSLPATAVGLAYFIEGSMRRVPRTALVVAGIAFIWWNLSLLVQHATGMIPRDQGVSLSTLVSNQLVAVPRAIPAVTRRYLLDRQSFYRVDPLREPEHSR